MFVALVGCMILVGRATATPNGTQSLELGICGDRPCFMGIVPGVTYWTDAIAQLSKYADTTGGMIQFAVNGTNVIVMPDYDKVSIINIDARNPVDTFRQNLPTAASFVDRYGTPCGVTSIGSPYGFSLAYPYMLASLGTETNFISPDSPVIELQVLDPKITFEAPPNLCASNDEGYTVIPWLGFTSIARYESHGLFSQQ
jgi:hypothetical protein